MRQPGAYQDASEIQLETWWQRVERYSGLPVKLWCWLVISCRLHRGQSVYRWGL